MGWILGSTDYVREGKEIASSFDIVNMDTRRVKPGSEKSPFTNWGSQYHHPQANRHRANVLSIGKSSVSHVQIGNLEFEAVDTRQHDESLLRLGPWTAIGIGLGGVGSGRCCWILGEVVVRGLWYWWLFCKSSMRG